MTCYRAEVQALNAATEHLIARGGKRQTIVLLTDSLSALQSLMSGPTDHSTRQLQNNLEALQQHSKVVLQWIPAHVGTSGNAMADMLPQTHSSTSYNEAKTVLRHNFKTNWQNRHHGYCTQHDHINKLERREQTTIFHLRTGHCGLKKTPEKDGAYRDSTVRMWLGLNRHRSTFSKSAHFMKRNVAKFGHMAPRSTPNSGGTSTTYEGRPVSPTPPD